MPAPPRLRRTGVLSLCLGSAHIPWETLAHELTQATPAAPQACFIPSNGGRIRSGGVKQLVQAAGAVVPPPSFHERLEVSYARGAPASRWELLFNVQLQRGDGARVALGSVALPLEPLCATEGTTRALSLALDTGDAPAVLRIMARMDALPTDAAPKSAATRARDGSSAPRRTLVPSFFVRSPKHLRARAAAASVGAHPRGAHAHLARGCNAAHAMPRVARAAATAFERALTRCFSSARQLAARHPHVAPQHLRALLEQLLRLDAARRPLGCAPATLLGAGDACLVPSRRLPALPRWTRWPHARTPMPQLQVRRPRAAARAQLARLRRTRLTRRAMGPRRRGSCCAKPAAAGAAAARRGAACRPCAPWRRYHCFRMR
jgi:hypothetical protein